MLRLLLAETSPLYGHALACLLEKPDEMKVVGPARLPDAALDLCREHRPDVLLLGERLSSQGVQLCHRLKHAAGAVCVVALVDARDDRLVYELLAEGVEGFVAPEDEPETVLEAVQAVARGADAWFSPRVAAALLGRGVPGGVDLTGRQRQIVQHAAMGHGNDEIAEALDLAAGTVRNHLSRIYRKSGVQTRAELVAWAWRSGIVQV